MTAAKLFMIMTISFMIISCNKEYVCECDNGNVTATIEAATKSEAEGICDTKGASCQLFEQ